MSETSSPFGRYVRARRIDAHKSLREVAHAIGVSHVYLGEVERGIRGPIKRDRWARLIDAVPGVTLDGLEAMSASSRPLQIRLDEAPPAYRDLALSLARRIEQKDLDPEKLHQLLALLGGRGDMP